MNRLWTSVSSLALTVILLAPVPATAGIRYTRNLPIYPNGLVEGESGSDPSGDGPSSLDALADGGATAPLSAGL